MLSFIWDGTQFSIPDLGVLRRPMEAVFPNPEEIQEIEVFLNIDHPRLSDLSVAVEGPNGVHVDLVLQGQLDGESVRAIFRDEATESIVERSAPYGGRFSPASSLQPFEGLRFQGTWTLVVTDHVGGSAGSLNAWSVTVNQPAPELSLTRAHLSRSVSGALVAPYRPGDELVMEVAWKHENVGFFTTGYPFTIQVSIDGQIQQFEDVGYGFGPTGGNGTSFRGWEATLGTHTVEVVIDPENRHWELNEADNRLTFEFEVRDLPRAERLVDITTATPNAFPHNLLLVDGVFYFLMSNGSTQYASEIWRSDGTPEGTTIIYGNPEARISELVVVGSQLYFVDDTFFRGKELWTSDGTSAGTRLLDTRSFDSQPANLVEFRGELYYTRLKPDRSSRSLWKTDGTVEGTVMLSETLRNALRLTPAGKYLYFVGDELTHGSEMWRTDGTPAGTRLIGDIRSGAQSSFPDDLTPVGNQVYFTARLPSNDDALWVTEGAQVRLVSDMWPGNQGQVRFQEGTELGGAVFFGGASVDASSDVELWRSNGTSSDTGLFREINPTGSSFPSKLTVVGDTLFFRANDGTHGMELWATEGTNESTRLVTDLTPGSSGGTITDLIEVRSNVVFVANQGSPQIFASDGTEEGTGIVALLPLDPVSSTTRDQMEMMTVGDRLYFFWSDQETGRNLWSVSLADEFPSKLPDLRVVGASLFRAPEQFEWGEQVELNVNVVNAGSRAAPTPPSKARVYLSTDPVITSDDVLLSGSRGGELLVPPVGVEYVGLTARGDELRLPANVPAEMTEEGVYYLGIVLDPLNSLEEVNEANNANQGEWVDVFPIRIGRPQIVHVVTHGLRLPWTSVDEFLEPWLTEYPEVLRELAVGTDLEHTMEIITPTWDSTTGFLWAFADEILYNLFLEMTDLPEAGLLAALARTLIVGEEDQSYRHAAEAAQQIFDTIQSTPHFQGHEFHLIGHSRGAAVNARLSQLLGAAGARVVQFTSLDGYSTDWPAPSGWLGDVSIAREAVADRKVNYRVEIGLNRIPGMIYQMIARRLSNLSLSDDVRAIIENRIVQRLVVTDRDWKAPSRTSSGMEDIVIHGTPSDSSDHMDVHSLYFSSAANEPSDQYILDSPLGNAVRRSSGESEPPAGAMGPSRTLHGFSDGTFSEVGMAWGQAVALRSDSALDDPLITAWLDVLQDSRVPLESRWEVQGDVKLVDFAGDWGARLIAGDDAALSQWVELDPAVTSLSFDLTVEQMDASARLEVFLGETVLQSWELTNVAPTHHITIPLHEFAGRTGQLGVRLVKGGGDLTSVVIDNLDIHVPLAIEALRVDPMNPVVTEPIEVSVVAANTDLELAEEVVFYVESNGVVGLQEGDGGDEFFARDTTGEDGWKVLIAPRTLLPGLHIVYAYALGSDGQPGLPAEVTLVTRFDDLGWQNPTDRLDVDANRSLSPRDALLVIEDLNTRGPRELERPSYFTSIPPDFIDTSGDGHVSPIDALLVINALNERPQGEGEQPWLAVDFLNGLRNSGPVPSHDAWSLVETRGSEVPLSPELSDGFGIAATNNDLYWSSFEEVDPFTRSPSRRIANRERREGSPLAWRDGERVHRLFPRDDGR